LDFNNGPGGYYHERTKKTDVSHNSTETAPMMIKSKLFTVVISEAAVAASENMQQEGNHEM
jgi:hypothetical protein